MTIVELYCCEICGEKFPADQLFWYMELVEEQPDEDNDFEDECFACETCGDSYHSRRKTPSFRAGI